jgi:hypothetical protein
VDPVELSAGVLRLRPWREDDVDAVWAVQQDPAIGLWGWDVDDPAPDLSTRSRPR